jgi:hypothetical protein
LETGSGLRALFQVSSFRQADFTARRDAGYQPFALPDFKIAGRGERQGRRESFLVGRHIQNLGPDLSFESGMKARNVFKPASNLPLPEPGKAFRALKGNIIC